MEKTMEIELKFRLQKLPPEKVLGAGVTINQGYLMDTGIRIRQKGDRYFITIKGAGDICREEWEREIPESIFGQLWPKTLGQRVEKTRYKIPYGDFVLEVDLFAGKLNGLVLMECEFKNIDDIWRFTLPEWAQDAIDVTKVDKYTNSNLAKHGLKGFPK